MCIATPWLAALLSLLATLAGAGEIADSLGLPDAVLRNKLEILFDLADSDHDGRLSRSEIEAWLMKVSLQGKERHLQNEVKVYDENDDGNITLEEYVAQSIRAMGGPPAPESENEVLEELEQNFAAADIDADRVVRGAEAERLLATPRRLESEVSALADEAMKLHDINSDGQISFEEFLQVVTEELLMEEQLLGEEGAVQEPTIAAGGLSEEEVDLLRREFQEIDLNQNGQIDFEELKAVLQKSDEDSGPGALLPDEAELLAEELLEFSGDGSSEYLTKEDVLKNQNEFVESVFTDMGDILKFPDEYRLERVSAVPVGKSRVEL